ncbi:MAG TPA: transposase [Longimicrobium sp.]|jgi:hypothetical protein
MPYYPGRDDRRTLRLRDYDYAQPGAYFITICTKQRRCVFGNVSDCAMELNAAGRIVEREWFALPQRFSTVALDEFVIMPNHVHAIIRLVGARFIAPVPGPGSDARHVERRMPKRRMPVQSGTRVADDTGAINRAPTEVSPHNRGAVTLGEVVRTFKAASAIRIRREADPGFAWQRNYSERVLRDDDRLARARKYVAENPARWRDDPER